MNEGTPRKERERVFRRNEIQNAASKLFATKGFNSTTLEFASESEQPINVEKEIPSVINERRRINDFAFIFILSDFIKIQFLIIVEVLHKR